MNAISRDLNALRTPLVILLLVVAVAGAGIAYTRSMILGAERQYRAQENQLRDARTKVQRSGQEKEMIIRYLPVYEQWKERGIIGPERRIDWLDSLRNTNQRTRMFGADYQIGVQQAYPYAAELNPGRLAVTQSLMKVGLRLVHEGDLMRFLDTLAAAQVGAFAINQCVLTRSETLFAGGAPAVRPVANLRADCELAWITINPEANPERRS
jgi:hypothetical protein